MPRIDADLSRLVSATRTGAIAGADPLRTLLNEVRGAAAARAANGPSRARDAIQRGVNGALSGIARLADTASLSDLRRAGDAAPVGEVYDREFATKVAVSNVHAGTQKYDVRSVEFPAGQSLDVNVDVLASAHHGALLLSFGGGRVNLSGAAGQSAVPSARFLFEFGGRLGSHELSFGSGVALSTIRDSINFFKGVTGVSAVLSGLGGIRISSINPGSEDFVSVRVIDHGFSRGRGVYSYATTNNNSALGPGAFNVPFAGAVVPIVDEGQDIRATINGVNAIGRGAELDSLPGSGLDASLLLTLSRAQSLGFFRALTVTGVADAPRPVDANPFASPAGTAGYAAVAYASDGSSVRNTRPSVKLFEA